MSHLAFPVSALLQSQLERARRSHMSFSVPKKYLASWARGLGDF